MKIRSITLGTPVEVDLAATLGRAGAWLSDLAHRFEEAGYAVQSTRVSLPPLIHLAASNPQLERLARDVDAVCASAEIGYAALGPIRWSDDPRQANELAGQLAGALTATGRVFGSIETADSRGVQFEAARAAAATVRALATDTPQGFGNLRFAALALCPPDIPFFPAAYHEGGRAVFSLALQAADVAVSAIREAGTLAEAEVRLAAAMQAQLDGLEQVARVAAQALGLGYAGADPTMAPFPNDEDSIGAAIEHLGVERFGAAGTLTAAALITRSLRAMNGRRHGFSGLMLPVLEDSVLARSAADQLYGWEELLLYSSVCGTGLDTVPLPGDIGVDELAAMILDVSTLAVVLQKPLTCRLFPIPGKVAGDRTAFDFPFFANGGVLPAKGYGSRRLLQRGLNTADP